MACNECVKIIEDLEEKLVDLKSENDHILVFSEKAVMSCKSAVLEMQNVVLRKGFTDEQDEIEFFKNIKPKVYGKLLYYAKIFSIETKRPNSRTRYSGNFLSSNRIRLQLFRAITWNFINITVVTRPIWMTVFSFAGKLISDFVLAAFIF